MKNNTIIGRIPEKTQLRDIFESNKAEFIAVYGRRRIGKTYLIEKFFATQPCLFFHITGLRHGTLKEQLSLFTQKISETFLGELGLQLKNPKDWMDAFDWLTNIINKFIKQKKNRFFL